MANTTSPNMNLVVPGVGTELSPTWATDLNSDLSIIDSHNHSSGQGVPIAPSGLNINADLAFQSNNATQLRSTRFSPQNAVLAGASDVGCLYVVNNELYYNDVTGGNNVQITANGSVNATSSGISSGTASAAFSAGVLVVKSSSTSGANVLMQSAVLTNSGNLTNQMTSSAPTLSGSSTITLPSVPAATEFVTIDSSGNMGATIPTAQGITRSNQAAVGQQISSSSGAFSYSLGPYTDVTNLSVSITTTGRPVMIFLQPDGSNQSYLTATTSFNLAIIRGATKIAEYFWDFSGGSTIPTSSISFLDTPSSGTYTYKVQVHGDTDLVTVNYAVLVAYEL